MNRTVINLANLKPVVDQDDDDLIVIADDDGGVLLPADIKTVVAQCKSMRREYRVINRWRWVFEFKVLEPAEHEGLILRMFARIDDGGKKKTPACSKNRPAWPRAVVYSPTSARPGQTEAA